MTTGTVTLDKGVFSRLGLQVESGKMTVWPVWQGCSDSLAIAELAQQSETLCLVVTEDSPAALRLEHEIRFFLAKEIPVLLLS